MKRHQSAIRSQGIMSNAATRRSRGHIVRGMLLCGTVLVVGSTTALALLKPPPPEAKTTPDSPLPGQPFKAGKPLVVGEAAKRGDAEPPQPIDPNAPRPVISAPEPTHDFGTVWAGPMLKHTFTIKNEGQAPLEISSVKPSCGCTIAGPYPKKIEAGQAGEFPFAMDSSKLGTKFEKAVTINSNDPVTPSFRLRLRGDVKRYIDVLPQSVQFGKLTGDEAQERVVKITSNAETPVELTVSGKPEGNFDVELIAVTPGKAFDLKVTAKPPFETGTFRKMLTLTSNVEAQKEIKIDCNGTVPERLEVNPAVLVVGSPAGQNKTGEQGLTRVVRVSNYGKTPVKVTEAKPSEPVITAEVTEDSPGKVYSVKIVLPPNYAPPAEGAVVTLKTDDALKPTIDIPVKGWGAPQGPDGAAAAANPPASAPKPAEELVGQKAPEFATKTLDGQSLSTTDLQGKITVLDFFANNCGFCKKQIPRLETVRAEYAEKGVRFVAISETMRDKKFTNDEIVDTLKQLGWHGEIVTDPDNAIGPLFRAASYPTMVVIGKTGVVEAVNSGNVADLESRLKEQFEALIAGKPVPKPAPAAVVTQVTPPATPPTPPAPKPDLVGKPAPEFSLTTFDGKTVGNGEFEKNGATVLNFVATNCGFCKKQIPRLETIRKEYAEKGVRFVNVVETMKVAATKEQIAEKMKELGSSLEVAHDPDNKVGPLFNATGFPTMVVLSKSGKVEAINVGALEDLETRLKGQLDAILAGKPVPQLAAAPPKPATPPPSLIGKPAPAIALQTFAGKSVSNADFGNAPATVLNFVASNCGYCKKQIPRLEKLRQQYAEKGIRFVNVVETMKQKFSKEEIEKIMSDLGTQIEVAHDPENTLGQPYNASGFPTMVIVGKSGKVEAINSGNMEDLEKRVGAQLDALIAGTPIPAEYAAPPAQASSKRPAEELAGKPAPAISLSTIDGKSISNDGFKSNSATVLNFFAPNCGFCKKQIPIIETVRKEYEAKGVRFVNVAQKMRQDYTVEQIQEVLKGVGSGLELTTSDFSSNTVGQAYKAVSFPTMFVVSKEGKIAHVNVGAKQDLEQSLKKQLDDLIAGKGPATP